MPPVNRETQTCIIIYWGYKAVQGIGFLVYMALGLLQLAAVISGLENWLGLHWIIAVIIALFVAYIPVVGSVLGVAGAIVGWGWEWWQAGLLFFGGLALSFAFGGFAVLTDWLQTRGRSQQTGFE